MGPKIDSCSCLVFAAVSILGLMIVEYFVGYSIVHIAIGTVVAVVLAVVFGTVLLQAIWSTFVDPSSSRRRLRAFELNHGRDAGWHVEIDGRRVAVLHKWRFEDVFWDSYEIDCVTADNEEFRRILTDIQWWHQEKRIYRNRETGEIAEFAFAGGGFVDGRILMRGLYLPIGDPNLWERMVLFCRRR